MRALRLAELRELLQGAEFAAWWAELSRAAAAVEEARRRQEDLRSQAELMELRSELAQRSAMDAFSRAGEAEDAAATAGADAQALENRALGLVARYEGQRFRTSDVWVRLGGAERAMEERRDGLAAAQREAAGARGEGKTRVAAAEAALRATERAHEALRDEYQADDAERGRLWREVEETWSRSFERSLLASERLDASGHERRDSERLFKEADERRVRAKQLRAEAEAAARDHADTERRRAELLERAAERFGCLAGDTFLYWRHPDEQRTAFAVSLHRDSDGHNVAVEPLVVYAVGRERGVALLEPAREGLVGKVEEGDLRFEEWFLGPRKGVRPPGGSPPGAGGGAP
ncbi:MAG TPA: hypothetical protein VLU43_19070 [Anaeromyxobacteraceae bacterium]|nr:hypothetical protein [Anaeromyxobacteraceae bacterium]